MPLEIDSMDLASGSEVNIFQHLQQFTDRFSADQWDEHIQPPILNPGDPTTGLEVRDHIYDTSTPYPQSMGSVPSSDDTEFETITPRREHQLSLEDELLLTLRNERGKTWRDISVSFENVFGKRYRAPALQMRYIRLQKRMRLNTDKYMAALFQTHAYWLDVKWQINSEKVWQKLLQCLHLILEGSSQALILDDRAWPWRTMDS